MRLPRFTADNSLYQSKASYVAGGGATSTFRDIAPAGVSCNFAFGHPCSGLEEFAFGAIIGGFAGGETGGLLGALIGGFLCWLTDC
jgi:hypothetical protein